MDLSDDNKTCPNCKNEAWRESADVGVGIIYGPWGCECGWSEDDEYNTLTGKGGVQENGSYTTPQGVIYPSGNLIALYMKKEKEDALRGSEYST